MNDPKPDRCPTCGTSDPYLMPRAPKMPCPDAFHPRNAPKPEPTIAGDASRFNVTDQKPETQDASETRAHLHDELEDAGLSRGNYADVHGIIDRLCDAVDRLIRENASLLKRAEAAERREGAAHLAAKQAMHERAEEKRKHAIHHEARRRNCGN